MANDFTNLIHEFYKIISAKNISQMVLPTSWVVFFELPTIFPGGRASAGGYSAANRVDVSRIKEREPDGVVHAGGTSWNEIAAMIPRITESIQAKKWGWLPASQVTIPGDGYNIVGKGDFSVGWGKGHIGTGRAPWQPLVIDFYELNGSIIDYILRPWLVMAAHNSLKIADAKSSIHILPLMKQLYPGRENVPRKIHSFFNCFPSTIGGETLQHSNGGMTTKNASFSYDYYSVSKPVDDFFNSPNPAAKLSYDLNDTSNDTDRINNRNIIDNINNGVR